MNFTVSFKGRNVGYFLQESVSLLAKYYPPESTFIVADDHLANIYSNLHFTSSNISEKTACAEKILFLDC